MTEKARAQQTATKTLRSVTKRTEATTGGHERLFIVRSPLALLSILPRLCSLFRSSSFSGYSPILAGRSLVHYPELHFLPEMVARRFAAIAGLAIHNPSITLGSLKDLLVDFDLCRRPLPILAPPLLYVRITCQTSWLKCLKSASCCGRPSIDSAWLQGQ